MPTPDDDDHRYLKPEDTPLYPALPTANKWRKLSRHGLHELTRDQVRAYGQAVLDAVLVLQRGAITRTYTPPPVNCTSGCASPDGEAIIKHVRAWQRRQATSYPYTRDPAGDRRAYNHAMAPRWRRAKIERMTRCREPKELLILHRSQHSATKRHRTPRLVHSARR